MEPLLKLINDLGGTPIFGNTHIIQAVTKIIRLSLLVVVW